jgi:Dyp-type peroxidase family
MPRLKDRVDPKVVQGNVLVGLNKPNVRFIFFKFGANRSDTLQWLMKIARRIPNTNDLVKARKKLDMEIDRNPNYRPQETWIHVSLSKSGIEYFGLRIPPSSGVYSGVGLETQIKEDPFEKDVTAEPMGSFGPFKDGLKGSQSYSEYLGDIFESAPEKWDEPYKLKPDGTSTQIDALFIIAADQEDDLSLYTSDTISEATNIGTSVVGMEVGRALTDEQGKQVEHFGFRDGISQPLIVGIDMSEKPRTWDWFYPEDFVLFGLNGGLSWANNGSFLVFRKLEQDVKAFWSFMRDQCMNTGIVERPEDLAAIMTGRWRSGAPLAAHDFDPINPDGDDENRFMYLMNREGAIRYNDPNGDRTATFAHIRWANPRDWSRTGSKTSSHFIVKQNKENRILRRGIPYGPPWVQDFEPKGSKEKVHSRGLLFVCYQRDIEKQYAFIQHQLSVDDSFPESGKNQKIMDMLRNEPRGYIRKGLDLWVTVKGGEFFFSPSLSVLKDLKDYVTLKA